MRNLEMLLGTTLVLLVLVGCGARESNEEAVMSEHEPAQTITNRIDIPPAVRKNLGITFAKVVTRDVQRTRRVPGRFELLPQARRAYHSSLPGYVSLRVEQYQAVKEGDVLFVVRSPAWREMQHELSETVRTIRLTAAKLATLPARAKAVSMHVDRLRDEETVWKLRLQELEGLGSAGGGVGSALTEARAQLAAVATALAKTHEENVAISSERATLEATLVSHREATPALYAEAVSTGPAAAIKSDMKSEDVALSRAAALLGVSPAFLQERVGGNGGTPRWRTIKDMPVEARQAGVIESLAITNGAWIDAGSIVLTSVDRKLVRFRASSLQADLAQIKDGLAGTILAPGGVNAMGHAPLGGRIIIGFEADPRARKIDLLLTPVADELPGWARPGVSTELEIVLAGTPEPALAIPRASIIQDGLEKVVFRRDPKDPNKVIRLAADLGLSDGRWTVIESGVMEGDEIVLHGVYELMLASGGANKQEGGHFHADGTWHAGDDH